MFYFKPPRGEIHLQQLEDCVVTRISYFINDCKSYNSEEQCSQSELMMCGTPLDRTGHFMLRVFSSGSHQLEEFLINSETKLFTKRIKSFTTKDLIQFLKTSIRHINELLVSNKCSDWLNIALEILNTIKSCALNSHYITCHHDESCSQHVLTVPFQYCLSLVKKREIHLVKGNGKVPCGKWKKLLENLFYSHLELGFKDIALKNVLLEVDDDPRLSNIKKIIHHMYYKGAMEGNKEFNIINANEVEQLSCFFPPCMSIIYESLKSNHRLSHQARYEFSLYLKDIGMPLKESIQFWKQEYSKPKTCKNTATCTHSWQKDSAKFEYSIRHLYGLEGRRKIKNAPSCLKIHSSIVGPTSEGGCPFVYFNEKSLVPFLNRAGITDEEVLNEILQLKLNNKPDDACFCYSKALAQRKCSESKWNFVTLHRSPVEFYNRVKI